MFNSRCLVKRPSRQRFSLPCHRLPCASSGEIFHQLSSWLLAAYRVFQKKVPFWNFRSTNPYDYSVLGQLDNLGSCGLLDHSIQFCLFGWPVIVTWICEPKISDRYFFSGTPCSLLQLASSCFFLYHHIFHGSLHDIILFSNYFTFFSLQFPKFSIKVTKHATEPMGEWKILFFSGELIFVHYEKTTCIPCFSSHCGLDVNV